jgi:hypothetical protein
MPDQKHTDSGKRCEWTAYLPMLSSTVRSIALPEFPRNTLYALCLKTRTFSPSTSLPQYPSQTHIPLTRPSPPSTPPPLLLNRSLPPSSIAAQLANTTPQVAFKPVVLSSTPLTLDNLDQLNSLGGKDVHLTSNDDISTNPKWLEGVDINLPGSGSEKRSVVIVVDKGGGVVDAFYFYFFAFNWGGVVLGKQLGKFHQIPPPPLLLPHALIPR